MDENSKREQTGKSPGSVGTEEENALETATSEETTASEKATADGASADEEAPVKKSAKGKNRKKTAMIFAAVVLVAILVLIPLTMLDYNAIFHKLTGKAEQKITYYPADYESDIFQSEEYLSHIGGDMTVTVNADGIASYSYPFADTASAKEAFAQLDAYNGGAGTLGDYFYALLTGCDSRAEQQDFRALFTKEAQKDLPLSFPPQKIYNIRVVYAGTYDYEGQKHERWRVSLEVVRNDGSALAWLPARDGGEAWFLLRDDGPETGFKIALISPIKSAN